LKKGVFFYQKAEYNPDQWLLSDKTSNEIIQEIKVKKNKTELDFTKALDNAMTYYAQINMP